VNTEKYGSHSSPILCQGIEVLSPLKLKTPSFVGIH